MTVGQAARTKWTRRRLRRAGGVDVRPRRGRGAGRRAVLGAEGPRRAGYAGQVSGGTGRACDPAPDKLDFADMRLVTLL